MYSSRGHRWIGAILLLTAANFLWAGQSSAEVIGGKSRAAYDRAPLFIATLFGAYDLHAVKAIASARRFRLNRRRNWQPQNLDKNRAII